MLTRIVRQTLSILATVVAASLVVFLLSEFSPGDAARKILGAYATDDQVARLTQQMGLDRPVLVRYLEYLSNILAGDLGYSTRFKAPVVEIISDRLKATGLLALVAFLVLAPFSLVLGFLAGTREGSLLDRSIVLFGTLTTSMPEFAIGVFLVSIFSVTLGWLPGTATMTAGTEWSLSAQLVLPVAAIVLFASGYVLNMVRASTVQVMQMDYVRTAILKGLPFHRIITHHVARNAMITPLTVLLLQVNYLISGVIVIETLFAYPGFGRMMLEAALAKDTALIEAGALVAVSVAVATQILGDLGYRLLDPRIAT